MKLKSIILVSIFVGFVSLNSTSGQSPELGPAITIEESNHDYGDLRQGEKVSHVFTFKNTGNEPLIISKIITTCGCTAPSWPKSPIPPGEEDEIKIVFDSSGKTGKQNKIITILSNATGENAKLMITASVLPRR